MARRRSLVLALALAAALARTGAAQCPNEVSHWGYGPTFAVSGSGHTVFMGAGTVLRIVDGSDPASPTVVGELTLSSEVYAIAPAGELLYALTYGGGLAVVDAADPASPRLVGTVAVGGSLGGAFSLLLAGSHLLVGSEAGLEVLDLSDPRNPERVALLSEGLSEVWQLAAAGPLVAAVDQLRTLVLVDLGDPAHPTVVGSTTVGESGLPYGLAATAEAAYVGLGNDGLAVVDLRDPAHPAVTAVREEKVWGTQVAGGYLYATRDREGFSIFDLADPLAPAPLGSTTEPALPRDVWVGEGVAWIGSSVYGLDAVDVSDPAAPSRLGGLDGTSFFWDLALRGSLAVASASFSGRSSGTVLLDLGDPAGPAALDALSSLRSYYLALDGDTLFASYESRVLVVDLSDPHRPRQLAELDGGAGYVQGLDARDGLLVASTSGDTLWTADVSDPEHPALLGTLALEGNLRDVTIADGVAYVSDPDHGLRVVSLADPSRPELTDTVALPYRLTSRLVVLGSRGIVGTSSGLELLDLGDPLHPTVITDTLADPEPYREITWVSDLALSGNLLAAVSDGALLVLDVSDPEAPFRVGGVELPQTLYLGLSQLAGQGNLLVAARGAQGVRAFDLSTCASGPPSASFVWSPERPVAGQWVRFTDTSTGSVTSRTWDFGDGSTSTDANPSHRYAEPGTYQVTLTVTGPEGSDAATRSLTVAAPELPRVGDPWPWAAVIPAAARTGGLEGTHWLTDLALRNPGPGEVRAHVFLLRSGRDNTAAEPASLDMPAGTQLVLSDVVGNLLGADGATGALFVGASAPLQLVSRTYNDAAEGTFGQMIPAVPVEELLGEGDAARLLHLTSSGQYRTNIGAASASAETVRLAVELHRADGTLTDTLSLELPPYGHRQLTDVFEADVADGYAVVRAETPAARWIAYASVVDNGTGDPVLILPAAPSTHLCVPAVAHVPGFGGSLWRTDLELYNPGASAVEATLSLLRSDRENPSPETVTVTVPPGQAVRRADVMGAFSGDGTGALLVDAPADLEATTRTYTVAEDGSYGQYIPAYPAAEALAPGQTARLIQLRQDAADDDGFRTNLGVVNLGTEPVTVRVTLYDGTTELGTVDLEVPARSHHQENRIFRRVTSATVFTGAAEARLTAGEGPVFVYASVVDNRSNDPVFLDAHVE